MRLWSIPTLVAAARRAALTPWGRKSRPAANRPRLELTPLEERVVLTAVAPNSYWDDGLPATFTELTE